MSLSEWVPTHRDHPRLRWAKRSFLTWVALNLAVVTIPLALRGAMVLYAELRDPVEIFRIEELFFFSLFVNASAIADLWNHTSQYERPSGIRLGAVFAALCWIGLVLATVYGMAFATRSGLGGWELVGLYGLMVVGVAFSALGEAYILDELKIIHATRGFPDE